MEGGGKSDRSSPFYAGSRSISHVSSLVHVPFVQVGRKPKSEEILSESRYRTGDEMNTNDF